jgi:8-oxo-dGTP pyrophosphatase MutT (NUDIX family)
LYHFNITISSQYIKIKSIINQASKLRHVEQTVLKKFYEQIEKGSLINVLFIGDHIKTGVWLVPGGHIETDEDPYDTVVREIKEELGRKVTHKNIRFFDISITNINSSYPCKRHWDLWFLYPLEKQLKFNYLREEYKITEWISI